MNITNRPYKRSFNPMDWSLVIIASITLAVVMLCCGCSTTWQDATGKTLASIAQTVDTGMKAWETYSVATKLPDNDLTELKVKAAYGQYQNAFSGALAAYNAAILTKDQTLLNQALAALTASENSLLTIIQTVTK